MSDKAGTVKTGEQIVLSRVRLKWDVLSRAHRYGYIPSPSELIARGVVLLDEETLHTSCSVAIQSEKLHTESKGKDELDKETIVSPVLSLLKSKGDDLDKTNNDLPSGKHSVTDQSKKSMKRLRTKSGRDEEKALTSEGSKKPKNEELFQPDNNALQQEKPRSGTKHSGKAVSTVERYGADQTFFKNNDKLITGNNFQGSDETENENFNLESQSKHLDVTPLITDSDKTSKIALKTNVAKEKMAEETNVDKLEAVGILFWLSRLPS